MDSKNEIRQLQRSIELFKEDIHRLRTRIEQLEQSLPADHPERTSSDAKDARDLLDSYEF